MDAFSERECFSLADRSYLHVFRLFQCFLGVCAPPAVVFFKASPRLLRGLSATVVLVRLDLF